MNKLFRSFPKKSAALALLATSAAASQAALPTIVETAITTAQTDTTAAVALMIGVVVSIWGLRKVMALFGR